MDAIVNINKEVNMTSRDVVNIVSGMLKVKAGHTGTLDPMATGVLPVCLGKATKIAEYITQGTKIYGAEVIFGSATDTFDAWGKVTGEAPFLVDILKLKEIIGSFVGNITQIPPIYSAKKINGKRLHKLAREGKVVDIPGREVSIYSIDIVDINLPYNANIIVKCSKGTYIRSLCSDIGKKAGSFAHMGKLNRAKSGIFTIKDSITLEELRQCIDNGSLQKVLTTIEQALFEYKRVRVHKDAEKLLKNGNKLALHMLENFDNLDEQEDVLVYTADNILCGIYSFVNFDTEACLKPKKMLL